MRLRNSGDSLWDHYAAAMRRVVTWIRSHPLVTFVAAFLTLVVALHLFLNWQGEQRWKKYEAEARARGVKLTLAEFAPPEIPAAENFAALPMLQAVFHGGTQRPLELPKVGGSLPSLGNAVKGEVLDWAAWQKYFQDLGWSTTTTESAPADVLRALDHYAPQMTEWREWRTRPRCRFPLNLQAGMGLALPHLSTFSDAGRLFGLRMRARLALGDSAGAYAELQDGLQAWRALEEEPTLISGLVQISALALLLNAVGAGLKERAWAETELEKIAADVGQIDVWESYRRAFVSERAFGNWMYEMMIDASPSKRGSTLGNLSVTPASGAAPVLFVLIPKRVYRENQLRHNRYLDEVLARTGAEGGFDVDAPLPSSPENFTGLVEPYYFFLFRLSAPVFSSVADRYVTLHPLINEVRIACALERHRLANDGYPETLRELTPALLEAMPLDLFSGKLLIYHRYAGTYLLYGVGKNRVDDGGQVDMNVSENKQPDALWLYAPAP